MNTKAVVNILKIKRKLAIWPVIIVFLIGVYFLVISASETRSVQARSEKTRSAQTGPEKINGSFSHKPLLPPEIKHLGAGWWESTRFIYHDIPARIQFYLPSGDDIQAIEIINASWSEFERIGEIFNPFNPASEVARLNNHEKSSPIAVSEDLFSVMGISHQLWLDSNGYFDPTIWRIKRLWQDAVTNQKIPSEKQITDTLQYTGFDKVHLSGKPSKTIQMSGHRIMFDFGGIVKGYAVDRVRILLIQSGVKAGLIQLGGEISSFGDNNGNPWRIGIQHPKQMDQIWGVISYHGDLRVSTSGNYRQPLLINGQSFYHIFDPKTGKPVSEKILGVTTASVNGNKSNALLDGTATAITVMGKKQSLRLARQLKIDVLILYEKKDGSIGELMSSGFLKHYEKNPRDHK